MPTTDAKRVILELILDRVDAEIWRGELLR